MISSRNHLNTEKEEVRNMAFLDRFIKKDKQQTKPEQAQPNKSGQDFESRLEDLRDSMLTTGNQFAKANEERVFIICAGTDQVDWFYQMQGRIVAKDALNETGTGEYDVSEASIQQFRDRLLADWQKILELIKENQIEQPKGMQLVYDSRSNHVRSRFANQEIDLAAEVASWMQEEQQKLTAANEPVLNWKEAYRAKVRYYSNGQDVMGAYAIGEGVDTVLPVRHPRSAYEGKEITHWELALVPDTDNQDVIHTDYQKAIQALSEIAETQVVDDVMLVKGLTLEQIKQVADRCGSRS